MARSSDIKIKTMKKYIEDDYESAYRKARKELGADLVIIDKKEIKIGGFLGLFAKKKTEVTFGVEAQQIQNKFIKTQTSDNREILDLLEKMDLLKKVKPEGATAENMQNTQETATNYTYNPYKMNQPAQSTQPSGLGQQVYQNKKEPVKSSELNMENLKEELKKELKEDLKKEIFKEGIIGKSETVPAVDEYDELIKKLVNNDVDAVIAEEARAFLKNNGYSVQNSLDGIKRFFMESVRTYNISEEKKYLMLVGPTGVGKTTSCAKIGANKYREDKQVAFITADTYRLEAVTQLKAYANIMQVPVEVIRKPEELNIAIDKLKNRDCVIMDTAGRSPRNAEQMNELREYVKVRGGEIEVILVLSATSKLSVMYDIIDRFMFLDFSSIILTKIDESTGIGSVLSIARKYNLPISFITNGQGVPDDIEIAEKQRLAEIFMEGIK